MQVTATISHLYLDIHDFQTWCLYCDYIEMKWKLLRHPDTMSKDSTVNGNGYFKGFHQPTNRTTNNIKNCNA